MKRVEQLEPFRKAIEFVLLILGLVYGVAFVVRRWPFPSASVQLELVEREHRSGGVDVVVIKTAFAIGSSSNVDVTKIERSCKVLSSNLDCARNSNCGDSEKELMSSNRVPAGDSPSWGCVFVVPAGACVAISQDVTGRGSGLAAAESYWQGSIITCGQQTGADPTQDPSQS